MAQILLLPFCRFHIWSLGYIFPRFCGAQGRIRYTHTDDSLAFFTVGSERLRVDSSGRVMLGDTSDSSDSLLIVQGNAGDSSTGGQISIQRGGSANPSSGADLGGLMFKDSAASRGAVIAATCDGDWASNDYPTRLEFKVTADGASSPSERLRIDSSGNLNLVSSGSTLTDLNFTASDLNVYARVEGGKSGSGVGDLRFHTYSGGLSEAMRIDSSGRLLLGTTTEGAADADNLTIADSGDCGITIRTGTTSTGSIYFSDATTGGGEADGYIDYNQSSRYMRFGTAQTERLRINSNGAWGIEGASNYGTSGQVLTSNGNDAPTWQDAGAAVVGGASAISMNDSVNINFGAGDDLQIFHDGTDSFVKNDQGDLILQTVSPGDDVILRALDDVIIQTGGSDNAIICNNDADVQLYYNTTKRFATAVDGASMFGNLGFGDGDQIAMGQSSDLRIYHDGSNSYIDDAGTGDLYIRSNRTRIGKYTGEDSIVVNADGDVELFHNNTKKFETSSAGVTVIGTTQTERLVVVDDGSSSPLLSVRADDESPWAFVVGNDNYSTADTGLKVYQADNGNVVTQVRGNGAYVNWYLTSSNGTTAPTMIHFDTDRAVHLNHVGNTKLSTKSDGVKITGHCEPAANNTYDLGTSSLRWRNVYTNDLNLSNEAPTMLMERGATTLSKKVRTTCSSSTAVTAKSTSSTLRRCPDHGY